MSNDASVRFWARVPVRPEGACWLWPGSHHAKERFFEGAPVHIVAWLLSRGEVPPKARISHSCRNKTCVNPAHLEVMGSSEAFWRRVDKENGPLFPGKGRCWQWTGPVSRKGYGSTSSEGGKTVSAYRRAYRLSGREVPHGLELDHLCRNRLCVNPDHLDVVTHQENVLRIPRELFAKSIVAAKRAQVAALLQRERCPHGHLWSENAVYFGGRTQRFCRACRKDNQVAENARKKARRHAAKAAATIAAADEAKAAADSVLEVANVKSPTGEPSRASGAVSFGAEVAAPLADESRRAEKRSVSAPAASCRTCGYVQRPGENWGHLVGLEWVDACKHVSGQRRCDCCTQDWYAEGNDSAWDCDGCAHEDCPECVAANGAEVAA